MQMIHPNEQHMSRLVKFFVVIAILYLLWMTLFQPDGGIADSTTYQSSQQVHQFKDYTIQALETYEGEFRVLSRENYNFGREAELSPVDFALGWGEMAKPEVYKQLSIRQSNRWYHWRYEQAPPIPVQEIASMSANTHLIPATPAIATQLKQIDEDDLIYLKGKLVEVTAADGWQWRSSLSRHDTGAGACELMLVEDVRIIEN